MLNELYVGAAIRRDEIKAKAIKSTGVSPTYLSKDQINAEAKKQADEATPENVTKEVLATIRYEADKTYLYFGKTSEILGEILKGVANSLTEEEVTNLSKIKKLIDDVTRACTPFYKTGTFIFLMSLFTLLGIATIVFTVIMVRRFMNAKEKPPPITPRV